MTATAFVFPGQGSQSPGMLESFTDHYPWVLETLSETAETLGKPLVQLIRQGPEPDLNRTENTQPAMLAADVAIWRAWCNAGGPAPRVLAGHSLGEYAALVAAGVIRFADALRLVQSRARWMQAAVPEGAGAMAAVIGLADEAVIELCTHCAADQVLQAVNFNAPGQVVVAGHREAVDRLLQAARPAGARMAKILPVSVPAHSALMEPVAQQLRELFDTIQWQRPRIPLVHNVDARCHDEIDQIKDSLARQVCSPVLWVASMAQLAQQHTVTSVLECGPGQVLTGLGKRCLRELPFQSLADPERLGAALKQAKEQT